MRVGQISKTLSKLSTHLKTFDYGMHEFGIRDDNGYHLSFGSPISATQPELMTS